MIYLWARPIKNEIEKLELNDDAPFMTTLAAFATAEAEAAKNAPESLITPP